MHLPKIVNNKWHMPQAPQILLVALPLGNPADLTRRASDALEAADWIFCEDTRKLKSLMEAAKLQFKAGSRMTSIPGSEEWNFNWSQLEEAARTQDEFKVVLCSDAGTPSINDPGRALVIEAQKRAWPVLALPGPSAPVMAIQWSGGFGLPLLFYGFAPKGGGKSFDEFVSGLKSSRSFVFFDTRYNVQATLSALGEAGYGERRSFLAREMTKTHEELLSGTVNEVKVLVDKQLEKEGAIGELTLIIEGDGGVSAQAQALAQGDPEDLARKILSISQLAPKTASKILSELSGLSKQDSYKLMVDMKKEEK